MNINTRPTGIRFARFLKSASCTWITRADTCFSSSDTRLFHILFCPFPVDSRHPWNRIYCHRRADTFALITARNAAFMTVLYRRRFLWGNINSHLFRRPVVSCRLSVIRPIHALNDTGSRDPPVSLPIFVKLFRHTRTHLTWNTVSTWDRSVETFANFH